MKLPRRKFILWSIVGAVAGAGGGISLLRMRDPERTNRNRFHKLIAQHFGYLKFGPGVIDRFITDYSVEFRYSSDVYHLATWLLLSTDFFPAADVQKEIGYVGFYRSADSPCQNPLAILDLDVHTLQ